MRMTWDVPVTSGRYGVRYYVPRIEVVGPDAVALPVVGCEKLFILTVLSYQQVSPLVARVRADNCSSRMWWSAGLACWCQLEMAALRREFAEYMARTGRSIFA